MLKIHFRTNGSTKYLKNIPIKYNSIYSSHHACRKQSRTDNRLEHQESLTTFMMPETISNAYSIHSRMKVDTNTGRNLENSHMFGNET